MDLRTNIAAFAFVLMLLPITHSSASYSDALNALNSAYLSIHTAQASVDALNSKIVNASTYGIPTAPYSAVATTGQSLIQQAKNADFSATGVWDQGNYDAVVTDETDAQNLAGQAQSTADNATAALSTTAHRPAGRDKPGKGRGRPGERGHTGAFAVTGNATAANPQIGQYLGEAQTCLSANIGARLGNR